MQKYVSRLFLANFIGYLYFYVPIFALFLLDNGIGLSVIVLGQMVYSAAAFVSEVPTGVLADRLGHNKSVTLGFLSDAVGLLLIGLFPGVIMLVVVQILRGISGGLLSGSKEALLYEYGRKSDRNYKRDLSHLVSYEMLGFAVSTLITGLIIQMYGDASYRFVILASFLAVFFSVVISYGLPGVKTVREVGRSRFHEVSKSVVLFRKNKLLKVLFIVIGLTYSGQYLLMDLYQPYFEDAGVAPFLLGTVISIGSIASFLLVRNVYRIEKPLGGSKRALGALASLTGVLYVALGVAGNPNAIVVVFVLLFAVMKSSSVFVSDYANKHAESDVRATVLSTLALSKEVFKVGYKAVFAVAVGIIALPRVFVYYGLFLIIGAAASYVLLGVGERWAIRNPRTKSRQVGTE